MKKILLIFPLLMMCMAVFACPLCKKQQPEILQGITHGTGPQSQWDYVIVWTTVAIVLFTLFYTIKYLVKPGEKNSDHIKRTILN